MTIKIGMVSLGCPKNQIDSEHILSDILEDKNFKLVTDENQAEVVIINTCAFIEMAKQEAIDTIFEFVKKKEVNLKSLIVTGCLAERYKTEILEEIPEIDAVIGIGSQKKIKEAIYSSLDGIKFEDFENKENLDLNGKRILSTPPHFAYLKIAEGCNNFCSYCAIPKIRGRYRSRKIEDILKEANWLKQQQVKELIIIAQDTANYGVDIYGKFKLAKLLEELSKIDFKWIRVLYSYPEKVDENLLNVINESNNILPYFDLPIQHICDEILKKMNRKTNSAQIKEKIELIRKKFKNPTIRTTLIAGFPGETDAQFEELLEFVKKTKFNRLGCFKYSQEEGTAAASLPNQISEEIKEKRTKLIFEESEKIINQLAKQTISKLEEVIVDVNKKDRTYIGRTKRDAPNVDCNVFFTSNQKLNIGDFVNVKIEQTCYGDLIGRTI